MYLGRELGQRHDMENRILRRNLEFMDFRDHFGSAVAFGIVVTAFNNGGRSATFSFSTPT
jgi:hypothetical protein